MRKSPTTNDKSLSAESVPKVPKKNRRRTRKAYLYNGVKFRSKFEAQIASIYDRLGATWEYEPKTLEYVPPVCKYTPDFFVTYPNGTSEYVETKGYFDPLSRVKMLCIKRQYPDLPISIYFQRDNKVARNGKYKYSDWCRQHGFRCEFHNSRHD